MKTKRGSTAPDVTSRCPLNLVVGWRECRLFLSYRVYWSVDLIEKETGMTDAECEYWDEYFTKRDYEPGPNLMKLGIKPGFAHKYLPHLRLIFCEKSITIILKRN